MNNSTITPPFGLRYMTGEIFVKDNKLYIGAIPILSPLYKPVDRRKENK